MIDLLLLVTLSLGAVAILTAWRVNGVLVSGVTVFWLAWISLAGSAWVALRLELLPEPIESSFDYIYLAYGGAFAGSMVGIFAAGRVRKRIIDTPAWRRLASSAEWFADRFVLPLVLVAGVIGLVHFVQRWALIDFDLFRIYELRAIARQVAWPWAARLASYASMVSLFMLMLLGVADAEYGVRGRRLLWVWLSTIPHGMAFAGRGWTLAPLLLYFFSYFIARQCAGRRRSLRDLAPAGALFLVGLWAFVVIGSVRNRQMTSEEVEQLAVSQWDDGQRYMMAGWLGSSLGAVGVQGDFVADLNPTYGAATFDWFSRKAVQLGLTYSTSFYKWEYWRLNILPHTASGSTWCVPPTALPFLILDFGVGGMPVALAVLVAALHWITVRWVGQGLLKNTLAFLALNTLFSTVQSLTVFSAVNVTVVVVALGARMVLPRRVRGRMENVSATGTLVTSAGPISNAS